MSTTFSKPSPNEILGVTDWQMDAVSIQKIIDAAPGIGASPNKPKSSGINAIELIAGVLIIGFGIYLFVTYVLEDVKTEDNPQ